MISSSQFFVFGEAPASKNNLNMFKITFSSPTVEWANQIACTSGTWSAFISESLLSFDRSTIYSFFLFGTSSRYLYFAGMCVSGGSVTTTRYKSDTYVLYVRGSALNGDYVVSTTQSPYSLVMYNISSSTFTMKSFSGYLYEWIVEPSSSR